MNDFLKNKKIALVYDDLVQRGGAESLFLFLKNEVFISSTVYVPIVNFNKFPGFKNKVIYSKTLTFLGLNFGSFGYRLASLLSIFWFESLDLSSFNIVFSLSNRFSHSVKTPAEVLHINYVTSPFRFVWTPSKNLFLNLFLSPLRIHNYFSAKRPNLTLAISELVKNRIKKYWGQDSLILYPPLIKEFKKSSPVHKFNLPNNYFLFVGRLLSRKNIIWLINSFPKNYNLVIVGEGPYAKHVKQMSYINSNIYFLGYVSNKTLAYLYSNCSAVIYPHKEDFGLVPLEALKFNKPVLCYYKGGFKEYLNNKISLFFNDKKTLKNSIEKLNTFKFNKKEAKKVLKSHNKKVFAKKINEIIIKSYEEHFL